jgi:recombination protein RecT
MGMEHSNQLQVYTLKSFNEMIRSQKTSEYLHDILSNKADSFKRNLTALVTNNINLQQCEPYSVMFAATKATVLDLPLDSSLGFAFVIPYKDNKKNTSVAQFQIGYKGLIQLAIRSGQYAKINVTDIREGEIINYDITTGEYKLKEYADFKEFESRNSKSIIGYLAYLKLNNGFEKYSYWCNDKIKQHAQRYSKSYNSSNSIYKTNETEMYAKTALKNLLNKWGILSIDMADAIKSDQAVITETGFEYIDNPIYTSNTEDNGNNNGNNGNNKASSLLSKAFDEMTAEEQAEANKELDKDLFEPQS